MRDDVLVFELIKKAVAFGQSVIARYSAVGGSIVAGGLSFYVFFALAPTALAVGALAGAFLTQQQVQKAIQDLFDRSPETLQALAPTTKALVELADKGSSSAFTITTIASFFVAVYVASRVVYGLRATLTRLFGQPERIHGLIDRGFSALVALGGMITVVALLLILQLLPRILDDLGLSDVLKLVSVRIVNWTALTVVAFVVCGLIIALLPDVPTRIRIRSWGVLFATLWMLGSSAVFGLYTSLSNTVGAAIVAFGTPIVLMLWLYLVFMGILIGAAIEAQLHGVKAPPQPAPIVLPHWLNVLVAPVMAKVGFATTDHEHTPKSVLPNDVA
ncbi:YihY/virulence factor BrkB family protein [bacterium]|nr:YihY/virulence factor BrkB family protein [bacterium]